MTRQDKERALMIVADAHSEAIPETGMTLVSAKLDRIYGYIATDGDTGRYANYLRAQIRAMVENGSEWNTPDRVVESYRLALRVAQRA